MHTDDHNAIRYLMKEMDPSEELEFEKLMREDEDLLIEVESLRATQRKLSGLSLTQPPENLTDQIKKEAKKHRSNSFFAKLSANTFYIKRSVAAAILVSIFTGGFYYFNSSGNTSLPTTNTTEQIAPWVDRNEVIRFSTNPQIQNTSNIQDELNRSYDKLQLVSDPNTSLNLNKGILLTGSSN